MNFEDQLAKVNARLKAGRCGVMIQRFGSRLALRGTFPPKPESLPRLATSPTL